MYIVFLAGGIGSGKSTVARELEQLGAVRIDLDQLSRDVLAAGSPLTLRIADAFGHDVLDECSGELDRRLLAQRAFATPQAAELLEQLELPAIWALLKERLEVYATAPCPPSLCVVEVPLLDRVGDAKTLADEVLVVCCPLALRRERAILRGMTGDDFDARVANQPTDAWLRAHANTVIDNDGDYEALIAQVRCWYEQRVGKEGR